MPETGFTEATAPVALHVPPVEVLVRVVVCKAHNDPVPPIAGTGITLKVVVVLQPEGNS